MPVMFARAAPPVVMADFTHIFYNGKFFLLTNVI